MFVNEDIVRETEKRMADKGMDSAAAALASEEAAVQAAKLAVRASLEGFVGATGPVTSRTPPSGHRRQPQVQAPAELESRLRHASFAGAVPSRAEFERYIGTNDLVDENYLERALVAARPVCRLVFKDPETGRQAYATGFMISPQLLLTNWHVFPTAAAAAGARAEFNYKLDIKGIEVTPTRFQLRPEVFHVSDKTLDYSVVAVSPSSMDGSVKLSAMGYHRLVQETGKLAKDEPITIIQHPEGGYRQVSLRENQLVAEPKPEDLFLVYRSDTAQGSSGSPGFNDSWQAVTLHHSGKAREEGGQYLLRDGRRVDSLKGVPESLVDWIANEGLRVSVLCRALRDGLPSSAFRDELLAAMDGDGDIMTQSSGTRESVMLPRDGVLAAMPTQAAAAGFLSGVSKLEFNAPQINFGNQIIVQSPPPANPAARLEAPAIVARLGADDSASEKLVQPIIDGRYSNRKGYGEDFIGIRVPLPRVTDMKLVSKMESGDHAIPYQHFSVVVNKRRRLALFTASNVDSSTRARTPDPDADRSRTGLTGLGKNDHELWLTDPRIPEQHQLPDVFFTKDRQAFDKGHIVRRDDVCWGKTFAQLRRANGDTFHTTNCSPQIAEFNRSNLKGEWGRLENFILKQAKTEKLALLAGPVLADDDEEFEGVDERGPITVQIPRRYWKVVCANAGGALQSFAFILEQDLRDVPLEQEFAVNAEWAHRMIAVQDLQDLLTGMKFDAAIVGADQKGTQGGVELAVAAELKVAG